MQRNSNRVEARAMQQRDVLLRDIVLAVFLPECRRPFWSKQLHHQPADLAKGLRAALEQPHVTLGHHPIAQIGGAKKEWFAGGIDNLFVLGVRELRAALGSASQKKNRDQLYGVLQSVVKKGIRKVIVGLNSTPQIDSSGLSTLVRISIQLAREGGVLRLVCGPGRVRDALTVTRLVEAIPTFDTESAALANFT